MRCLEGRIRAHHNAGAPGSLVPRMDRPLIQRNGAIVPGLGPRGRQLPCAPAMVDVPRTRQRPMQSFSSDGVRIAYIDVAPDTGRGDPILLIHGFASNHAVNWVNTLWVTTLRRAGLRVVALDNRGHGQSEKPHRPEDYDSSVMAGDARRLLDHLEIPRADIMGYSMGARIGAHLAIIDPPRVRSLILGGLGIRLVH